MAKKKYSIQWEDDLPVSFEVNGQTYESLDDIPDAADRRRLEAMMDSSQEADFEAEFDQAQKEVEQNKGFPVEKVVLSVFTGIAALMLMIAGIASYRNIQKIYREESAPGVVVDLTMRPQYSEDDPSRVVGEIYYPVVEFVAKDGKRRTVQLDEGSFPPSYEAGDEVVILYEPENPQDARIKSVGSSSFMWILPGITGILGIAFLGAVIAVQRLMRPAE